MTDKDLIDMLRTKQICTGFKPDGHGDVDIVYGPDPVTVEAADRIEALTAERDRLRALLSEADRRIVWEANGFGSDFAERVEAALKGETP